MIKVIDGGKEFFYDSVTDVHEDYPDAEVHNGIVIVKEQG